MNAPFRPRPLEPHNAEAEGVVLGACLASSPSFSRIVGLLDASDFYEPLYADCWKAMREFDAQDRRADLITLASVFQDRKVGDTSAREHLDLLVASYSGVRAPSDDALDAYVKELRRYAAQRLLGKTGQDMASRALEPDPNLHELTSAALKEIDAAIDRTQSRRTGARTGIFASEALRSLTDENAPRGLPTGLKTIDRMTGGLYRGELSIVGGRPGSGKTTLAIQIAMNLAQQGSGVLFLSLEMSGAALNERMLSNAAFDYAAPIPYTLFRTDRLCAPRERKIKDAELARLEAALQTLSSLPLWVEDQGGMGLADIERTMRAVKSKLGSIEVVIVDHLDLVMPAEAYRGQRVHELSELTAALKRLAKTQNVHVMALHQLNRGVEGRDDKRPQLQDLRNSGSCEQDADLVLTTYRESYYLERAKYDDDAKEADRRCRLLEVKNDIEVAILKQRNGSVGVETLDCSMDCARIADKRKPGGAL